MPRNLGLEDAIPLGLADAARYRTGLGLFAAGVVGSRDSSEKLFHLRLHRRIHLDERRPGAFETFAGNFLRRINAEFAATGDFARGVVEHVGRAFGEEAVAWRIGVGRASDVGRNRVEACR